MNNETSDYKGSFTGTFTLHYENGHVHVQKFNAKTVNLKTIFAEGIPRYQAIGTETPINESIVITIGDRVENGSHLVKPSDPANSRDIVIINGFKNGVLWSATEGNIHFFRDNDSIIVKHLDFIGIMDEIKTSFLGERINISFIPKQ